MILFLFTSSYPYDLGAEQSFLGEEINYLKERFERVILVPRECAGKLLPLQDGIEVEEGYSRYLTKHRVSDLIKVFLSSYFYSDILSRPAILLHISAVARLIKFISKADITRRWVENWLTQSSVSAKECLFYTYWFDDTAMGIGLVKNRFPDIRVISRTHGYDLYEERYDFPYWPCRRKSISLLDRIFPDSETGLRYISNRYPRFISRYETAILGVKPAGFVTKSSQDGVLRIVSCSTLVPVKRIDLLLEGISYTARQNPEIQFYWYHFGNGVLRETLHKKANMIFPSNAHVFLPGYSSQQDLFSFYKENPVDVFVNVSASEGTPVAIMEAISCSIPIIATSVGGNVEIVSSRNGFLLSTNPTSEEIAAALINVYADPEGAIDKKRESYFVWQEKYNAESNFQKFADLLIKVRGE